MMNALYILTLAMVTHACGDAVGCDLPIHDKDGPTCTTSTAIGRSAPTTNHDKDGEILSPTSSLPPTTSLPPTPSLPPPITSEREVASTTQSDTTLSPAVEKKGFDSEKWLPIIIPCGVAAVFLVCGIVVCYTKRRRTKKYVVDRKIHQFFVSNNSTNTNTANNIPPKSDKSDITLPTPNYLPHSALVFDKTADTAYETMNRPKNVIGNYVYDEVAIP